MRGLAIICLFCNNRELISEVDNNIISFTVYDQIFLDFLLIQIRGKIISNSTFKKRTASKRESQKEKEVPNIYEKKT